MQSFDSIRGAHALPLARRQASDHVIDFRMTLGRADCGAYERLQRCTATASHTAAIVSESWRPIEDEERRPPQATLDQIIENGTPGFGGFAAHALDPEHQLLAVLAHADDDQQGDRSGSGWRATGICSSVRS
jgi:hypothetical protein